MGAFVVTVRDFEFASCKRARFWFDVFWSVEKRGITSQRVSRRLYGGANNLTQPQLSRMRMNLLKLEILTQPLFRANPFSVPARKSLRAKKRRGSCRLQSIKPYPICLRDGATAWAGVRTDFFACGRHSHVTIET